MARACVSCPSEAKQGRGRLDCFGEGHSSHYPELKIAARSRGRERNGTERERRGHCGDQIARSEVGMPWLFMPANPSEQHAPIVWAEGAEMPCPVIGRVIFVVATA